MKNANQKKREISFFSLSLCYNNIRGYMKKIVEIIKRININGILKRYFFFFLVFLFLEGVFAFIIFDNYTKESIINVFLYSSIVAVILSLLTGIFSNKVNNVLTSIILFIFGFLFSAQLVFYNVFKTFISFSILGLSDQLKSFLSETIKAIISNFLYIIIFMLPFIIYLIFKKKININKNILKNYIIDIFVLIISLTLYIIHMNSTKDIVNGTYSLYHDVNNINLNINKLGVNNSYLLDIYRTIVGFDEKVMVIDAKEEKEKETIIKYDMNTMDINFSKETSNNDIKTINNYMKNIQGTEKNKYTGLFKGKNLIYIVAESFSEIAVSEELTPTLYKLTHSGFIFDNYYTPNTLSTIGGEFQALTGLYPDSGILTKWRSGTNYFPYGLGTIYRNLGYDTYAYHNNWYGFQDRHKYLKSQGFTNYIGCSNGMEKKMNCKPWPQSDLDMMKGTVNDYINNDKPFMAYYMTVSGHFSYNFSDNSMASKNKKYVNDLNVSTSAKAYVATQIELDRALEYLLKVLEEKNKLDDTVIVLLADHYPYKLDLNSINSLSNYKRDNNIEVNHNALILWNNKINDIHITKPCMSSDVLPTVYNLFGVDYDSRLLTGEDILSNSDGLVIFNNRSWITEKGIYHSSNGSFVKNGEVDDNYVNTINSIVKNRLTIGKLIIKSDYYKYLLK